MHKYFAENACLSTPTLGISVGSSAVVKYTTNFSFIANGRVSPTVTAANAPSLATAQLISPLPNGTAVIAGVLATGYARIYTLVGILPINGTATSTPVFSWLASADFVGTTDVLNVNAAPMPNGSNQTPIGFVGILNQTGSNFTPNTTALDAGGITTTYINNFGL